MNTPTEKRGPGRPRQEGALRAILPARVSEAEAELVRRAAKKSRMEPSAWMRKQIVEAALAATAKG